MGERCVLCAQRAAPGAAHCRRCLAEGRAVVEPARNVDVEHETIARVVAWLRRQGREGTQPRAYAEQYAERLASGAWKKGER